MIEGYQRKLKRVVGLVLILIVYATFLVACGYPIDHTEETVHLLPKDVITYYVNARNEDHGGKINAVLSDGQKAITVNYDAIKHVEIVNVKQSTDPLPSDLTDGLYQLQVYEANLLIDYTNDKKMQDQPELWYFYVGKEKETSPWLIYDIK